MSDQGGARGMRESGGAARMIGSDGAEGGAKTEQNSLWRDKSRAPPPNNMIDLTPLFHVTMSSFCIAYGSQHIHNPYTGCLNHASPLFEY